MDSMDLRRLWALHEVDAELADIKKRAAGLDIGQEENKAIQALEALHAESSKLYHDLLAAQSDVTLQKQGAEEKLKQYEKKLYDGGVTNPREIANYEKEVENLKKQVEAHTSRLADIHKAIPPLKIKEDELNEKRDALKKRVAAKLVEARKLKPQLEEAYKAAVAGRAAKAKVVTPGLLARYEAIRNRQQGVGMGMITKDQNCSACGTNQAAKVVESVKTGRIVTCEACHRILYYTEGVL